VQNFSQLKDYGREQAEAIVNSVGNVVSGVIGNIANNYRTVWQDHAGQRNCFLFSFLSLTFLSNS
jgi:hypothetical protein